MPRARTAPAGRCAVCRRDAGQALVEYALVAAVAIGLALVLAQTLWLAVEGYIAMIERLVTA